MSPVLLDLFGGAGGAAMGYHRAGWDVIGVDISPQKNYPFRFIQADAIHFLKIFKRLRLGQPFHIEDAIAIGAPEAREVAAIHASPPCQYYSLMSSCRPGLAAKYPNLVPPTQQLLDEIGLPYVIENVPGAPLRDPIMLCGHMFGYELYRHRLFESNVKLTEPLHPVHVKSASKAGHWRPGTIMSVAGHVAPIAHAREIMDMDWSTRDELTEAIPPYDTEYIGKQLVEAL